MCAIHLTNVIIFLQLFHFELIHNPTMQQYHNSRIAIYNQNLQNPENKSKQIFLILTYITLIIIKQSLSRVLKNINFKMNFYKGYIC